MQHLVSPSAPEKCAMRETIEHEVQRFLEQGGKITVLEKPSPDRTRFEARLWDDSDEDLIGSD